MQKTLDSTSEIWYNISTSVKGLFCCARFDAQKSDNAPPAKGCSIPFRGRYTGVPAKERQIKNHRRCR